MFRIYPIIILAFIFIPISIISKVAATHLPTIYSCGYSKNSFRKSSPAIDTGATKAFSHIKSLAGDWEGTYKWSGGRTSQGKMDAKYYLTGNGSAVVEDLLVDGKPMMTTVYHLDGPALRMTHYCGAGNQPRLKLNTIDEEKKTIHFEFVDATNLASLSDPHVDQLEVDFKDDNHITLVFTFKQANITSYEHIELSRAKNS